MRANKIGRIQETDQRKLHNVQKCLKAGYETVIVCSSEKKDLEKIQVLISKKLDKSDQKKVLVLEPKELFQ
ncbi:MAG: hypothetical protein IIA45_11665 [Bacteroidetes bacterium]|nr:hypothetical protein [Bacteroidota bacterium]